MTSCSADLAMTICPEMGGNDELSGGPGTDTYKGGSGNDTIYADRKDVTGASADIDGGVESHRGAAGF